MPKLAIVASHPIQYYSPLFKTLAEELNLKVFYCHNPSAEEIGKEGFKKAFKWDVDLLDGYEYEFLENRSKKPSLSNFNGCDTPQIGEKLKDYGATHVVVFGWYLKSFLQTLAYCKKNKIPVAARGDSQLNPNLPVWKMMLKRLYYPFFLKKYDAFLYVGKRNKEYLQHYGVPDNKLIFSPHAVDQDFWKVNKESSSNNEFTFIWVGKFTDKKRPWDVLEAFASLYSNAADVQLNMIGTGEYFDFLMKKYVAVKNIFFKGFKNQTELLSEYQRADCLLLSSDYGETWGLVVNEAMSCGLPAIVSHACGCSGDLIEERKTGYLFHCGELDELGKKMKMAVKGKKRDYTAHLDLKNEIYSFQRNIQSFQEFIALPKK